MTRHIDRMDGKFLRLNIKKQVAKETKNLIWTRAKIVFTHGRSHMLSA